MDRISIDAHFNGLGYYGRQALLMGFSTVNRLRGVKV
jgi:hypothetical protein